MNVRLFLSGRRLVAVCTCLVLCTSLFSLPTVLAIPLAATSPLDAAAPAETAPNFEEIRLTEEDNGRLTGWGENSYMYIGYEISQAGRADNHVIYSSDDPPPDIEVAPTSFEPTTSLSRTTTQVLTIENVGAGDLHFSISENYVITPTGAVSGGPDDYGYTWVDSDEPGGPAYDWVEINAVGTALSLGDDAYQEVSLPFTFNFYGQDQTTVKISSNGYLTFGSDVAPGYTNRPIPDSEEPNYFIAPFWDDLNPPYGLGAIFYYYDASNQRFIVEYEAVHHYPYGDPETFEVLLYADGAIVYQYQSVSNATSCTVGIENSAGSDGLQVVYNSSYLHDALVVKFLNPIDWLSFDPDSGTVLPSDSTAVTVTFGASELSMDTYEAFIIVSSDDPDEGEITVPVTLTVAGPCTDPPTTPYSPSPADDATGVSMNADLTWSGGHPCPGEAVTYTVYLDTSDPPTNTLICDDVSGTTCDPGTLSCETHYYWQVVANGFNGPSNGSVWDFTTGPCIDPPATPYDPSPADDAANVSISADLTWSGGHPCPGESVTYTVYFDTSSPPTATLTCGDVYSTTCDPGTLGYDTHYYWQVVANGLNGPSDGPVWDFTTEPCPDPPTTPYDPSPADGATGVSMDADLSWSGGHPCPGEAVTYTVYFDTSDPPTVTLTCDDVYSTTCDPGTLDYEAHYYWQVVANGLNGPSDGPVWDFTTGPCIDPPAIPYDPSPADGTTDVSINGDLSWSGGHPCPGEAVTYTVYFDTSDPPTTTLTCDDVYSTTCDPGTLGYDTHYYWRVVANGLNGPSDGPVWDFTTEPCPDPPTIPYGPSPADGATGVSISADLSWSGGHPCPGEAVTYTVYFDTSDSPTATLTCDDVYSTTCDPGTLSYDTHYYWQVVANGLNGPGKGPVWDFTTGPCIDPPATPYDPSPADDATNVSISADLSWSGGHPCPGEAVTYTVYFDTSDPPTTTLTCDDVYSTTCDPGTLGYDTHYYWQVVANGLNGPSDGPVWDFTTEPCPDLPTIPYNPSPADGATDVSSDTDLSWSGGHPCPGEAVTYTVYFDTSNPPTTTLTCGDVYSTTCDPGALSYDTHYYWQVAANGLNGPSDGPVWDFTTSHFTTSIGIEPVSRTVVVDDVFTVEITIHTGIQPADGAEAHIDFDPDYLIVVDTEGNPTSSIISGTTLSTEIQNSVDNSQGTIDYAAGMLSGEPPTGAFTLATIRFHAITETLDSCTSLTFVFTPTRNTDVVYEGLSVLGAHTDGCVTIEAGACITGAVTLQGRPAPPDPSWSIPVTFTLYPSGGITPTYTFAPTTDISGTFTVCEIAPATYDLCVKNAHTLSSKRSNVEITLAPNSIALGTLREGDADDDDCVTITDFSLLRLTFARCEGSEGFNPGADFNGDGCVNISDFSLLRMSFGECGECQDIGAGTLELSASGLTVSADTVSISIVPSSTIVWADDIVTVDIVIEAGSQSVDGAEAHVDFDPDYLTVVDAEGNPTDSIISGAALPTEIQNSVDNSQGTIDYAAGILSGEPPTGAFTLATIRFKAEAPGPQAGIPLSFVFTLPRKTQVVFEAYPILGDHTDGNLKPRIFGDFDGNCVVEAYDILQVADRWCARCGDPDPACPSYDPLYDLDDDCSIDIMDIMLVAVHWGETCE